MGNGFSDIGYGKTEIDARNSLISSIIARHSYITTVDVVKLNIATLESSVYEEIEALCIQGYGYYRIHYYPKNTQVYCVVTPFVHGVKPEWSV